MNPFQEEFDLGEAVLELASRYDPSFTREKWDDFICTSVSLFSEDDSEDKTALERLTIFNYLFFNRLHFSIKENGDSRISKVISGRCGCAQTVALLWFVLAYESDLPVRPYCAKGGFIPVWMEGQKPLLFIDLLENGNPICEMNITNGVIKPLSSLLTYYQALTDTERTL